MIHMYAYCHMITINGRSISSNTQQGSTVVVIVKIGMAIWIAVIDIAPG